MNDEARELIQMLDTYQTDLAELHTAITFAFWDARTTGDAEAFERTSVARLAFGRYHSNTETYERIKELRQTAVDLDPITARAAERMERAFAMNQLPEDLQRQMVELSSEIEKIFQTYRPVLNDVTYTNNDLLEMIAAETDSEKRKQIWEALKQVGDLVNEKIIALAKVRNEAARKLGFNNYWEMSVTFQDFDPAELIRIFDELEELTRPLFANMKAELDAELSERFNVPVDQLMPWHYDNPFFQAAPPSSAVDPDDFYRHMEKEEIVEIALRYFRHLGLPFDRVAQKSDMFEREGKCQHAFSIDMDRMGDVRNLNNVKPTAFWMDVVLHEAGHGVYSLGHDPNLPFNLRVPAHIVTTEGVAMLFGALARDPQWLVAFAGADPSEVHPVADALRQQRVREQLIFCRWSIVMLKFEKALYEMASNESPDANLVANLKALWWDMVGEYQLLRRPTERGSELGDWASKPHFVIAPVYYHNYILGELYASQLRAVFARELRATYGNLTPRAFGRQLQNRVFAPGARYDWQEFVRRSTGRPLSPTYFAREVQ